MEDKVLFKLSVQIPILGVSIISNHSFANKPAELATFYFKNIYLAIE